MNKFKDDEQITSWNILNDVQFNQKDFFLKPRLLYQNRAYVIWLRELVQEIKKLDSKRPVFVDLEVNQLSEYHCRMLGENKSGIDGYALVVKNTMHLNSFTEFMKRNNMNYFYSEIDVDTLIQNKIIDDIHSFYITSWRDRHESNLLTFNGITDRKGRFRREYFKLMQFLKNSEQVIDSVDIRILKPSTLIYENGNYIYYAVIFDGSKEWKFGTNEDSLQYEWSLVKCDKYGNYLAVKDIGKGPVLALTIPKQYDYFKLLLTASNGKTILTDITTLNTPLIKIN